VYATASNILLLVLGGAGAGALGALLGVGGGVFLIPFLVVVIHLPMHHAIATGLVSVIATSTAAAMVNVDRGLVNVRLAIVLEIATATGAIAGGFIAGRLPGSVLQILFAAAVLAAAALMWRGIGEPLSPRDPLPGQATAAPLTDRVCTGRLGGAYIDPSEGGTIVYEVHRLGAGLGVSTLAGGLSGLLGIGGGVFKVPALHIFCKVPMKAAAATSNFMIGVTAVASAFLYLGRNEVRPVVTGCVVLGVMVGSFAVALVNRRVSAALVRRIFAVFGLVVAVELVWRAFR
jgi:uncharacterized membrane protein YfcA